MSAIRDELQGFPAPLEFLTQDSIHPDNKKVIEQEQRRWRLLGTFERWRLQWYVWTLARQLRRAHYNDLISELARLKARFDSEVELYHKAEFINDEARQDARQRIAAIQRRASELLKLLRPLRATYANFDHYSGWLEYERRHRRELREEDRYERQVKKDMQREAAWLETIIRDVWRKTAGCHHMEAQRDNRPAKARAPRIERSLIRPDAHYFYVAASRKTLLGWRWLLPYGVEISRLSDEEVLENMRAATRRQVDAVWSETNQLMIRVARLDSPDALPTEVKWRDAMEFYPEKLRHKFPFCIGITESRKFRWFNFQDEQHFLLAGKTKSGKSNLVNGMIATLVSTHSPDELRIVLIDQKGGIEFTHWKDIPHLLGDMIKTVDGVKPALERLVAIMRHRMASLERVKAKDVDAYNNRVDVESRMARVVIFVDELNTFVGLGRLTEEIHNLIMLLVSQGRAMGLHVVASTQHPEVKVIPGRIKTNMARLSGPMPTVSASMIILDNPEAARLPNIPGRFVAVSGLDTLTVQVPHILDADIAGVVSACKQAYPDVSEQLPDVASDIPVEIVVWNEQRVLVACLEWLEGHLGGKKLHGLLGDESPGERHFNRVCRRLIDQAEAIGFVQREDTGERYTVKRRGKGWYLQPLQSDQSDKPEVLSEAG